MPTNAVYQPTTVTFENSGSLLEQTTSSSRMKILLRKKWMKFLVLFLGLFFLALGIIVFGISTIDYEDSVEKEDVISELPHEREIDVILIIIGVFFIIFGLIFLGKNKFFSYAT